MSEFEKLYEVTYPKSENKNALYFQGEYQITDEGIVVNQNEVLDLGTYFNSFSIIKWIKYTTINKFKVELEIVGNFFVDFYGINETGEVEVLRLKVDKSMCRTFDVRDFNDFDLIGIRLTALTDSKFIAGTYFGAFETVQDIKLGITICTFKREKYLKPNLDKLKKLDVEVMVIDNAQTLEEIQSDKLQIIHNQNYGGAGGFTRGMIEQVNQNRNSHILLMDDDVVIELSAIERLIAMLKHLKSEHQTKFFAGAMLKLDKPTIQHENTACFKKIIRKSFGHNLDLTSKYNLCVNEHLPTHENNYAAWWFCCIPINQIKSIGYPLPIFIKCDDMEYGFRNQQDILTMNGIGIWHEAFENKVNLIMGYYFGNRNTLLMNHFAKGCDKITFSIAVLGRVVKSLLKLNFDAIRMLEVALKDLNEGLEGMTKIPADEKFESLKNLQLNKNIISTLISIVTLTNEHISNYDNLDNEYKNFREENLKDQKFWIEYMKLEENL